MNQNIEQRLSGIQQSLMGQFNAGAKLSSASKGSEREVFTRNFLQVCCPPPFRFGTGDITDANGECSGQVDIAIELPFAPSLAAAQGSSRLYLAESVAAVIEVKSDLSNQWTQVVESAKKVQKLLRSYIGGMASFGGHGINEAIVKGAIPFFAVGFKGWSTSETVQDKLKTSPVDGILVIENGFFESTPRVGGTYVRGPGPWGLWTMLVALEKSMKAVDSASVDLLKYARP